MADLQYPRADQAECPAVNERENLSRITMMNTRSLVYFRRRDPKKSAGLSLASAKRHKFPDSRSRFKQNAISMSTADLAGHMHKRSDNGTGQGSKLVFRLAWVLNTTELGERRTRCAHCSAVGVGEVFVNCCGRAGGKRRLKGTFVRPGCRGSLW